MLNPKEYEEVQFWRQLVNTEGSAFLRRRRADYYRHLNNFNGYADLSGYGIEIGTGCYSMLEWSNATSIIGVEPLQDEFVKIQPESNGRVSIRILNGEELPDTFSKSFDWAVCFNVIDHTPNPQKMVNEMFRVVKNGGHIYFEVNFDDVLGLPHYSLWNENKVNIYFPRDKQIYKNIIRNEKDKQSLFYAVYQV